MKRSFKFLCLLLALVTCFFLVACEEEEEEIAKCCKRKYDAYDFYPEGYTCGFPDSYDPSYFWYEIWWVETYDELIEAIELLKSHGSTFEKTSFFTYDEELFDTKFCITIPNDGDYTDDIKFGDNPFDRKASGVKIESYAFFEDVTIDELNYGNVLDYHIYRTDSEYFEKPDNPTRSKYSFDLARFQDSIYTFIKYDDVILCKLYLCSKDRNGKEPISDETVWVLIESLKTINREGDIK